MLQTSWMLSLSLAQCCQMFVWLCAIFFCSHLPFSASFTHIVLFILLFSHSVSFHLPVIFCLFVCFTSNKKTIFKFDATQKYMILFLNISSMMEFIFYLTFPDRAFTSIGYCNRWRSLLLWLLLCIHSEWIEFRVRYPFESHFQSLFPTKKRATTMLTV